MKITKTQAQILEEAKHTIAVLREYKDFSDFFDNCEWGRQMTFSVAKSCNNAWNSAEKWKMKNPKEWARMENDYYDAVNEQIIIVFAKTESINALEKAGLIKIIEAAQYRGGAEKIKIL